MYSEFFCSLKLLINNKVPFEVRTTLHSSLLDQNDIQKMIDVLEEFDYKDFYFIQQFMNDTETLTGIENSKHNTINVTSLNTKLSVVLRN